MDLAEWLLARIAEDEARAFRWPDTLDPPPSGHPFWLDTLGHPIYEPRPRVLAECAAKRAIVELHSVDHGCPDLSQMDSYTWVNAPCNANCTTLRLLALPYVDEPGYRPEWAPSQ